GEGKTVGLTKAFPLKERQNSRFNKSLPLEGKAKTVGLTKAFPLRGRWHRRCRMRCSERKEN
ncbi:MAG: hypothetical protein J6Y89_10105, partial [Lachnospiraceae bacterium]|nr:hypothetical protein [Lachnospiraceae bacterium]